MNTYKYRVLMTDSVNGQEFSFAMFYTAMGIMSVSKLAQFEFPNANIIQVRRAA